jgi:hypothetical protein
MIKGTDFLAMSMVEWRAVRGLGSCSYVSGAVGHDGPFRDSFADIQGERELLAQRKPRSSLLTQGMNSKRPAQRLSL